MYWFLKFVASITLYYFVDEKCFISIFEYCLTNLFGPVRKYDTEP